MSNIWFISDTHFDDSNLVYFKKRPFASVEEMNWTLIDNWNRTVQPDDIVYHLGDVFYSPKSHSQRNYWIIQRLNGIKYLIKGNHDYYVDWRNETGCGSSSDWKIRTHSRTS